MARVSYTVKTPLHHDGKTYAPGTRVDLEDDAAQPLLAAEVIEVGVEPVPAEDKKAAKK